MKEEIIKELRMSNDFLAILLEETLKGKELIIEEENLKIAIEEISVEVQMALIRCGYLIKRPVNDTKVFIRIDKEYIYFWIN